MDRSQDEKRRLATEAFEPVRDVLVFQGSPRGKHGRTEECLQPFLEGVGQAGGRAEMVYLKDYKIEHCLGCFSCWMKHPGRCVHQDDMAVLHEKMREACCMVVAAPLYVYSVPGLVKDFLDRSLPMIEPWLVEGPDGRTTHPYRWPKKRRFVLFSVCGFPEVSHFESLVGMFQKMWSHPDRVMVGTVLRPSSESLPQAQRLGPVYGRIMDAFRRAGQELVELGWIREETERDIQTPVFDDPRTARDLGNAFWRTAQDYYEAKGQGRDLGSLEEYLTTRPDMMLTGMAAVYRADKGGDLEAVIQFILEGQPNGEYHLDIAGGNCYCRAGRAEKPDLTITTPWSVWWGIAKGRINGQEALMQGQYQANGDLGLLMRLGELFGGQD